MTQHLPAILHIPHASKEVPHRNRTDLLLSDEDLARELLLMTDSFVDELFCLPSADAVRFVYPVSRLVVDPERLLDDGREPMAAVGMGVIYTKTASGADLRLPPTDQERAELLSTYYVPHHRALEDAVDRSLRDHGRALIFDCHSFPSAPLPYEPDQSPNRPDLCVGTDDTHTPAWLTSAVCDTAMARGFSVDLNRPFAGTLVPLKHLEKDDRVWSVMIEVKRSLYMHEGKGTRLAGFGEVRDELTALLSAAIATAAHEARGG
jgi:N-formylglutamate amidohydrolase